METDDSLFAIHEPEAAVVRNMYAWLIDERITLYGIQRRLNDLGIAPPNQDERRPASARERGKRTRRTSKRWQGFTVKRILSSSFYAGERLYGKRTRKPRPLVSGTVPAIVTPERYQQSQLRLAEQRARHARGQRYDYLLKGKIRCAACGHAYSGAFDHTVQHGIVCRYTCTGSGRANERGSSCDNPSVRADIVEPLIWNDIRRFLKQPELVLRHFDQESDQHRAAVERQREQERALQDRRATLADEIERWLDLYPKAVSGHTAGITVDDIDRRVANLRSELDKVEHNIARFAEWTRRLEARDVRRLSLAQLLERLGGRLNTATPDEKTSIVHDLVQSIHVEAERDQAGRPVFHYQKHHRPDGSFWYAHRVPHVTIKVVYAFPDEDFPANEGTQSLAHGQEFIVATSHRL
ncbi:MAG TPA: recombinase family protein [Gaiellaceae bacterium]